MIILLLILGGGGQAKLTALGRLLGDECILVSPQGYENSWQENVLLQLLSNNFYNPRNVYGEKSKADDVQFILDLIAKIGRKIPEADMNDVNIVGKVVS